jgi:hypothetical protein
MEMSCQLSVLAALRLRDTAPCIFFIGAKVCRLRNFVGSSSLELKGGGKEMETDLGQ